RQRLREQERGEHEHRLVDRRTRGAFLDGLDEAAEQRRAGEARSSGGAVQRDDQRQATAVSSRENPRLGAQLAAARDREQLAHSSSPRVTVSRYPAWSRSRARWPPSATTRPSST